MSWEMFCHGKDARALQASRIGHPLHRYLLRLLTERAQTDHRVIGIAVHIQIGCEIDMNAQFPTLPAYLLAIGLDQSVIGNRPEHHVFRETSCPAQAHRQAPLAIQGDQQRNRGSLLQPIGHHRLRLWVSLMKQHSPDLHLLHVAQQPLHIAGVRLRIGYNHEKLPDALVIAHRIEHGIYPVVHLRLIHRAIQLREGLRYATTHSQASP